MPPLWTHLFGLDCQAPARISSMKEEFRSKETTRPAIWSASIKGNADISINMAEICLLPCLRWPKHKWCLESDSLSDAAALHLGGDPESLSPLALLGRPTVLQKVISVRNRFRVIFIKGRHEC